MEWEGRFNFANVDSPDKSSQQCSLARSMQLFWPPLSPLSPSLYTLYFRIHILYVVHKCAFYSKLFSLNSHPGFWHCIWRLPLNSIPYSFVCCPHLLNSFLSGLPKHYQRGVEMLSTHQGRRSKDKLIFNVIYFHIPLFFNQFFNLQTKILNKCCFTEKGLPGDALVQKPPSLKSTRAGSTRIMVAKLDSLPNSLQIFVASSQQHLPWHFDQSYS